MSKYGAYPLRGDYCHEMALRILLYSLVRPVPRLAVLRGVQARVHGVDVRGGRSRDRRWAAALAGDGGQPIQAAHRTPAVAERGLLRAGVRARVHVGLGGEAQPEQVRLRAPGRGVQVLPLGPRGPRPRAQGYARRAAPRRASPRSCRRRRRPERAVVARALRAGHTAKFAPGVVPERPEDAVGAEQIGGPIWAAPMHDMDFVREVFAEVNANQAQYPAFKKMHGLLTSVLEELPDAPLFLSVHTLAQVPRAAGLPACARARALSASAAGCSRRCSSASRPRRRSSAPRCTTPATASPPATPARSVRSADDASR
eukprot:scaffold1326_cov296-Prasinococcus_capsulatus_cf.AAC.10